MYGERERKEAFKKFKVSRGEGDRRVCVCVYVTRKKHVEETGGKKRWEIGLEDGEQGWRDGESGELGYRSTLSRDPRFIVNTNELQVDRARALIEKVGRR